MVACAAFYTESRMKFVYSTKYYRKFRGYGAPLDPRHNEILRGAPAATQPTAVVADRKRKTVRPPPDHDDEVGHPRYRESALE
jgi:hypothetical protein